jgi:hypothetical protein
VKTRTKRIVAISIVVALLGCCCITPLPVACGAPGMTCRTGPGPGGASSVFYELEPLGVVVIEAIFRVDLPIYYTGWDSAD